MSATPDNVVDLFPKDPDDHTDQHPPAWHVEYCMETFAVAMQNEIDCNRFKGDWRASSPEVLTREVVYHAHKMLAAVQACDFAAILEYAADCANLAMYVADATGSLDAALLTDEPAEYREDAPDRGAMFKRLKDHAADDHARVLAIIADTDTITTPDIPF